MTVSNLEANPMETKTLQADTGSVSAPSTRIHYLDNLRALAMLLGVLLHAGLAYANPAQSIWLATDSGSSVGIDAGIWFIHLFRMGLFFLLSGYFAKLVIERKGMRAFLWNRFLRIVLPFVLSYPFLLAAMTVVIIFSLSYLENPQGLMGLIANAAKNNASNESPPPTTMHLWFLYYLIAFSLLGAAMSRITWLRPERLWKHTWLMWLSPMILVPAILSAGMPLPAPESFIPQWWPFVYFGGFYFAGWQLFGRESVLQSWAPFAWHLVAGAIALFLPYYFLMPVLDLSILATKDIHPVDWRMTIEAILTSYLSALLIFASLLLGYRYLEGRSPFLRFVADSSYWVYLIHLPIVLFLQSLLIPISWPVWIKFVAVIVGTLIPCMATYVVFVRYTPIGWMLHGKRRFP